MHKQNELDSVIIKSKNGYTPTIFFLFCCILFVFIFLEINNASTCFSAIFCGVLILVVLRYWIATGRTLVMDKNGCTISFLWFKKAYSWGELRYRYSETYEHVVSYKSLRAGGCVFSKKPIQKPKWMGPIEYCTIVHPFTVIFICYTPPILTKAQKQHPLIYPADKEKIASLFLKWGVKIGN